MSVGAASLKKKMRKTNVNQALASPRQALTIPAVTSNNLLRARIASDLFIFFQAEDGIRDYKVTGVQTCALPIYGRTGCASAPVGWPRAMTRRAPTQLIAFQGERGAFSEEAARKLLGAGIDVLPCPRFEDVFRSLQEGAAAGAVIPIENTLAGSVHENYDHLQRYEFPIVA